MRVIEEFSFDEEPGKTQVKSNITESVEKPNISISLIKMNTPTNRWTNPYSLIRVLTRKQKSKPF